MPPAISTNCIRSRHDTRLTLVRPSVLLTVQKLDLLPLQELEQTRRQASVPEGQADGLLVDNVSALLLEDAAHDGPLQAERVGDFELGT